jgi:phospholipid/cholesterol/gamma-HCH transport system ATP-binding protein
VIVFDNVSFRRGRRVIFSKLSLEIEVGQITAILGPSGSGKTTLLRLIGGQLYPSSGKVWVEDQDIASLSREKLYALRRRMGMLFQSGALLSDLTVFENVAFPLRRHTPLSEEMIRDLVLLKLDAVGLRGARDLMPHECSGGMARRVALARAIALDPDIIMYDEPFSGQDPILMGILTTLTRSFNRALNLTSVLVSHDVMEMLSISDKVYIIGEGRVMGEGTPENIQQYADPWVTQFLQGKMDGPLPFHYPAAAMQDDFAC